MNILKEIRLNLEWTQIDMARFLNCSQAQIAKLEMGISQITIKQLNIIITELPAVIKYDYGSITEFIGLLAQEQDHVKKPKNRKA